jgi:hypothetical protein
MQDKGERVAEAEAPTIVKRTVPRRPTNADVRPREYLTADEVEQLMQAAA